MREPSTLKPSGGRHPAGETKNQPFQFSFNRFLHVAFQGSRVTSDGGLILVREVDERFGLSGPIREHLADSRTRRNRQFPPAGHRPYPAGLWQSRVHNILSTSFVRLGRP